MVADVRRFLEALASGYEQHGDLPRALRRIARRALGGGQTHDKVDDALAEFLVKLVEATRRGSPGGAGELLALDDRQLLGALKHRIRQSATDLYLEWPLVKCLRAHVRVVLEGDLPLEAEMPLGLLRYERLACDLVKQACAAVLAQPDAPPRRVPEVADALLDLFFSSTPQGETQEATQEDLVEALHDARVHAQEVAGLVGPESAAALGERAQGKSLREVGMACGGLSPATMHAHLAEAQQRLRSWFGGKGLLRGTQEQVLALLAEAAAS